MHMEGFCLYFRIILNLALKWYWIGKTISCIMKNKNVMQARIVKLSPYCVTQRNILSKNRTAKKKPPEKNPEKINYVELRFSELHIFLTFKQWQLNIVLNLLHVSVESIINPTLQIFFSRNSRICDWSKTSKKYSVFE